LQKIDDDMKRELRLLRLRSAYDPKRFYKSFDNTKYVRAQSFGVCCQLQLFKRECVAHLAQTLVRPCAFNCY
jgi:hypothetical protein